MSWLQLEQSRYTPVASAEEREGDAQQIKPVRLEELAA
jgi:hypothetical protein